MTDQFRLLCKTSAGRWAIERLGLRVEVAITVDMLEQKAIIDQLFEWQDLVYSVHLPFALAETRLNIAALDDGWRKRSLDTLAQSMAIAARLNPRLVVIHAAPQFWNGQPAGDYDRLLDGLQTVAAQAQKYGFLVCLENNRTYWDGCPPQLSAAEFDRTGCNTYFASTPADWQELVRDADVDNLRLCLDTSHAVTTCQTVSSLDRRVDILNHYLEAGQLIAHVHWNDNQLVDARGRKDTHLPLGTGSIPLDFHRRISRLGASLLLERNIDPAGLINEMAFIDSLS